MNRSRVAMTLLLLSGLMALPACGSSTKHTATTARPASLSVPASVRIGGYTQVFATPLPANEAQASVIESFREAQVLWTRSLVAWRLVAPVTRYVTGVARTRLSASVARGKQYGVVPTGGDRLFMARVTALSGRSATVTTCDDGSKFREAFASTGQIDPAFTAKPDQAYLFETWHLVEAAGHWAINTFTVAELPDKSAGHCQP
jgi:hypothetical protein